MRNVIGLLPIFALAACGGQGPQSVGSIPVPATSAGVGFGGTDAGAPGSGGTGGGVPAGGSTGSAPLTGTSFLTTNPAKTYDAIGGSSSLSRQATSSLYRGNAATVAQVSGTIAYDPRDGIFTVKIADTKSGITSDVRFQDPFHSTDFNNTLMPQAGVPNLPGFSYLEALGSTPNDLSTFFFQRPGEKTVHVTLAGWVRNNITPGDDTPDIYERGAFVFGDKTPLSQLPTTGSARYTGGFLAAMVNNPTLDSTTPVTTVFQWLTGNSTINVNFGAQTFNLALDGRVNSAGVTNVAFGDNTQFFANGSGSIDLLRNGGFAGAFQNACFVAACGSQGAVAVQFNAITPGTNVTGASSIDGAFYGPAGVNVGGSFRIIGGVPDQRIDINGAFTGAKVPN